MGRLTDAPRDATAQAMDLRAWCDEQNRKRLFERMERWYFVARADDIDRIDCLNGSDATNVRKLLNGQLADFAGWPAKRMDGYRNWLHNCAEQGLLPRREAA